jgi:hypothetical protein
VLEKGSAGARYHAIGDEGVPFRDIAEVIGRRLHVPVASKRAEEAGEHFGWMSLFAGLDMAATSQRTSELLSWKPEHASLLEDIDGSSYFERESAVGTI